MREPTMRRERNVRDRVRLYAQITFAVIAVLAATGAILRFFGLASESPFAKRIVAIPDEGPVGMGPFLELHGYGGDEKVEVYLCATANDTIDDCAQLAAARPDGRLRSKPIPATFGSGDDIVPASYPLRAGPDEEGRFPVRGTFDVVPFEVGKTQRPRSFAGLDPSKLGLGRPTEVASGVACRPPLWLPDGRLAIGSTIFDPSNGVTIELSVGVGAAELAWAPDGDKVAILTTDRKEIRLAGPDGSGGVAKVREARGLLSSLSWSPSGDRLAFIAANDPTVPRLGPGPPTVNILNAINGERTQAGPGLWVAWGPADDVFAVERAGQFVELGKPDGSRRRVVDGVLPTWSSDGRLLATIRKIGEPGGWVALADGSKPSPIVGGGACAVSFSPGGHTMAIVSEREGMRHLALRPITTPS